MNNKQTLAMKTLTIENAPLVSTVSNKKHPEWGTFRFQYNAQPLTKMGEYAHVLDGQKVLFNTPKELNRWNVESFK